jgi:DNA repair exonuclease SbcCD ATPase subunit
VAELKQDATTQREELSQQHSNEIDRLMTLLGNERGEWRQAKQELQAEVSALQNALQERQKTVESQSVQIIQLNKDLLNQTEALARLKTTEASHSALRAKLEEVSAENKALHRDNERLTQQLPTLQALVSQVAAIQGALTAQQKTQTNKQATKSKPTKGE